MDSRDGQGASDCMGNWDAGGSELGNILASVREVDTFKFLSPDEGGELEHN